ncbi:MAG: sugar ABC transporter substrate-binding protein [Solirubrobacterales bacterium]
MRKKITRKGTLSLLFALLLAIAVASCGGGSDSTIAETGGSEATTGEETSASGESDAQELIAKWFKGTFSEPQVTPVKPPSGKSVWVIGVGQLAISSKLSTGVFAEEGPKFGWKVKVFDGKFEPSRWLEGIRNAVAANADAIWTYAIDCPSVASALKEAKAADIPVINTQGIDCSEEGGEELFTYSTRYGPGDISMEEWAQYLGNGQGSWIAAEKPDAKILSVVETDLRITSQMGVGFEEVINDYCPGCEIVEEIDFVGTEIGPTLQDKVEQALLRHPEVDAVYGNYDDVVVGSVAPAIRNSGRSSEISLIGCEGQAPNIEMVYNGEMAAGNGISNTWEGFSGLDATIRILAGEEPIGNTGNGAQLYDIDHNLPPKGDFFEPTVEYKSVYRKAWGIE